MLLLLLTACGQLVSAPEALQGADNIEATVELPGVEELSEATTLQYYAFDGLLREHVAEVSWEGGDIRLVDYAGMLEEPEAGIALADTLTYMAAVDPALLIDEDERLAFWINVYNAWTIQGVLSQLSQDPEWIGVSSSTWDGEDVGVDFAMFNVSYVEVGGQQFTLNAIEHGIIRGDPYAFGELEGFENIDYFAGDAQVMALAKQWHSQLWGEEPVDARIHMGLNCASYGCPDILSEAFKANRISEQLDAAATRFLAHPGKGAGADGVTQLFSWFGADFVGDYGSVEDFVSAHREGGSEGVNFESKLDYSWELNILE